VYEVSVYVIWEGQRRERGEEEGGWEREEGKKGEEGEGGGGRRMEVGGWEEGG
jgi:hypothetical protein